MGALGIGVGTPFKRGGGISWSSYWLTRFPSVLTLTVNSDTQVTLNWTNNGTTDYSVSIEQATDMITFTEVSTVATGVSTKVITGLTESTRYSFRVRAFKGTTYSTVYSNIVYDATLSGYLDDGNTKFGFDFMDLDEVTQSSNLVSLVNDIWGAGNDLKQTGADGTKPLSLDIGLHFDGSSDFLFTDNFTFNRPEFIYAVIRQMSWTLNDFLFDGATNATGLVQQSDVTPRLNVYAGAGIGNTDLKLLKWGIARVLFNATNSSLQIDANAATTGNTGTGNMGGFTLGCAGARNANYAHFQIKGIIGRATADDLTTRTSIYNFLKAKYFPVGVWGTGVDVLNATIAGEEDNIYEPCVLYEANPQILAGTVFKMWFSGGWANPDIYYAESLDGLTWSKYSATPVIADHSRPCIIKVGSTYYAYAHEITTNRKIDLYTSSDGVNFSLASANVLVPGASGAWDDLAIHNTTVIIEDGTWYMYYDGIKTGAGEKYHVGLATSPNGITWTKHASNPVIGGILNRGSSDVHKIGDVYYLWCLGSPYGFVTLPTDFYRYKSTDLITWVQDVKDEVFIRTQADEGVGSAKGQVADPMLIEVNNKVYLFYAGSADGSAQSGHHHINLSIADMPFTDLVKTNEGTL